LKNIQQRKESQERKWKESGKHIFRFLFYLLNLETITGSILNLPQVAETNTP